MTSLYQLAQNNSLPEFQSLDFETINWIESNLNFKLSKKFELEWCCF